MQDLSSTVSFTPSFSFYVSGNGNIVETAVRVVSESQSYSSVKVDGDGDENAEFEFETSPLSEESFFHFPTTTEKEDDADRVTSKNLFYGGWVSDQSLSSPSQSHSSSESDASEDLSPSRYYCFWRRCSRIKDFLRRSHSAGGGSGSSVSPSGNGSPAVKGKNKTASRNGTSIGEVNMRRKTYLPYRQDLIAVFAGRSSFRQ